MEDRSFPKPGAEASLTFACRHPACDSAPIVFFQPGPREHTFPACGRHVRWALPYTCSYRGSDARPAQPKVWLAEDFQDQADFRDQWEEAEDMADAIRRGTRDKEAW